MVYFTAIPSISLLDNLLCLLQITTDFLLPITMKFLQIATGITN